MNPFNTTAVRLGASVAVVLLALLAFGQCLRASFVYDDVPTLLTNPAVRGSDVSIARIFTDASTHTSAAYAQTYRPLRTIWFRFLFRVFGEAPAAYHLLSLFLHAAVAALGGWYALRWVRPATAFTLAALFSVHPLTSEVILSVKSQDDLLSAGFVLLGLIVYYSNRLGPNPKAWLCALLYAAAILAKESALVLPLLFLAHTHFSARSAAPAKKPLALFAVLAVCAGLYLLLRAHALAVAHSGLVTAAQAHWPFWTSFANIPRYWLLLIMPWHLTVDYSWLRVLTPFDWQLWVSAAFQAAVIAALWRTRSSRLAFGISWFYIAMLPSLNLLPGSVIFAERFAYLPMWGLLLLAAVGIEKLSRHQTAKLIYGGMAVVIAALVARSMMRTSDWRNNVSLFRSALHVHSDSPLMRQFLATELRQANLPDEAAEVLDSGPASLPASPLEQRNLRDRAFLLLQKENYTEARPLLELAAKSPFASATDWLNFGTALLNTGDAAGASDAFGKVLAIEPGNAKAHRMLGRSSMESGNTTAALENFLASIKSDPAGAAAWYSVVKLHTLEGRTSEALETLSDAHTRGVSLKAIAALDFEDWTTCPAGLKSELLRQ
jgi:tetratricopeptide (TPR) repeat protein